MLLTAALAASASAQLSPFGECSVQVMNQAVKVDEQAGWTMSNIPVNGGQVRARVNCFDGVKTRSGQSAFFVLTADQLTTAPEIVFGDPEPGPTSLLVDGPSEPLTQLDEQASLLVVGRFPNGSLKETSRPRARARPGCRPIRASRPSTPTGW